MKIPVYDPNRYLDYAAMTRYLQALARAKPNLIRVRSIGKSYQGRDLLLAEVTNRKTGKAEERPAHWVDGSTHAGELAGSAACLHLLDIAAREYGRNPEITHLLNTRALYVLPRISPDGQELCLSTGRILRSSVRPHPESEPRDGLEPKDMDGDGEILQMRVEDPLGEWKLSAEDPRLLLKREPADRRGPFYRIYAEGVFHNYDGFHRDVPADPYGLDFNRNYPCEWRPEPEQWGAGFYPLSEPETRAIVDFFLTHPNIGGVTSYHTFGGIVLRPFSNHPDSKMPIFDRNVFDVIGKLGAELTGYPCHSVYSEFRWDDRQHTWGAFDDWAYLQFGVLGFTVEIWNPAKAAGREAPARFLDYYRAPTEEEALRFLQWFDSETKGTAFVPWRPFDHPQLGPVEIGGWRVLTTWMNPPAHRLGKETEPAARFALAHAATSPRLIVESFETESLADGLTRITLVLANEGYLPTSITEQARKARVVRLIRVELDLPAKMELVEGRRRQEVAQLEGTSAGTHSPFDTPAGYSGRSDRSRHRLRWIVRGRGAVIATVRSDRAGTVRASTRIRT